MRYANLNGNSNVLSFEIGSDYIDVTFGDYSTYRYSYSSAGRYNVEEMKRLYDMIEIEKEKRKQYEQGTILENQERE